MPPIERFRGITYEKAQEIRGIVNKVCGEKGILFAQNSTTEFTYNILDVASVGTSDQDAQAVYLFTKLTSDILSPVPAYIGVSSILDGPQEIVDEVKSRLEAAEEERSIKPSL